MTERTLECIAADMARVLRNTPCSPRMCIGVGSWPLFKAEAQGKHKVNLCTVHALLEQYDEYIAHRSIVQTPAVAAEQARALLRAAADKKGERND